MKRTIALASIAGYSTRQFVEYKAEAQGMQVLYANPTYTLQTCSCCLFLGTRQKHRFSCLNCGSYSTAT